MSELHVGEKAPAFSLPDQTGVMRSVGDFGAKYIVLYFYPKDDTPGCTLEGREFTHYLPEFKKLNAHIVGISGQDPASKQKFCAKHDLKVTLLSDEDFAVSKKFGSYGEKKFMGKTYLGVLRNTFIIDAASNELVQVYLDVKADGHAEEVLAFLRDIKAGKSR